MKTIKLNKGREAFVDDEDYERLNAHRWRTMRSSNNRTFYAIRWHYPNQYSKWIVFMHNEVLMRKATRGIEPDHLDGNGLNNQKSNLEIVTHRENVRRGIARKEAKK